MKKRILALLCCLVLLTVLPQLAAAHDVPDFNRKGSVSINLTYKGEPVSGGIFSIYRVADVVENNGDFSFRMIDELSDYDISLDDLGDFDLAQKIEEAVRDAGLPARMDMVDDKGHIAFGDLSLGLYLLIQPKRSDGYNAVEPFLVAVPNMENGTYNYDVNASPKVELEPAPTTKPTDPPPGTTLPGKLPQTGQNNWPVPVMLVFGMLFVFAGCWLHISGKGKKYEE